MGIEDYIIVAQIILFLATLLSIVKGVDWIMVKVDKRMDERIMLNEHFRKLFSNSESAKEKLKELEKIGQCISDIKLILARKGLIDKT